MTLELSASYAVTQCSRTFQNLYLLFVRPK